MAAVNTSLILVSGGCLAVGYALIKRGNVVWHQRAMLTATLFAALFLVVYVTRYLLFAPKLFAGEGSIRTLYLGILGSHTVLATLLGPLVLVTLARALRRDYARHKRLARVALPIWLYVAVTGWVIYAMLHAL